MFCLLLGNLVDESSCREVRFKGRISNSSAISAPDLVQLVFGISGYFSRV